MLASMRLCSNTPGQLAIQTALGGYQSIDDLVAPGGRLARQRDLAHSLLTAIPGVTCVKPKAALYMFPRLDPELYPIDDDQQFAYELLAEQKVLIVQGTGLQLAAARSLPRRLPAEHRRPHRGHGPDRHLPRALPRPSRDGASAALAVGCDEAVQGRPAGRRRRRRRHVRRPAAQPGRDPAPRRARDPHHATSPTSISQRARRVAGDAAEVGSDARALIARPGDSTR